MGFDRRMEAGRAFLKDTIRLRVDFAGTAQSQGLPPPPLQKPCPPEALRIALPSGAAALDRLGGLSLAQAIARRRSERAFGPEALSLEELAALLWATQGVREVLDPTSALRTVPSAGARHAFETYLAVCRVEGLSAGLYRYLPLEEKLARLQVEAQIGRRAAEACLGQGFVARAAVTFFWTVLPERMEWRYDLAAHKVLALDAGHVCQNLYLASTALGLGTCAIAAYDQEACDRLLGVDGQEEFTLYLAPVGRPGSP
jgi:SagB-type dehydrogenase family enzyme